MIAPRSPTDGFEVGYPRKDAVQPGDLSHEQIDIVASRAEPGDNLLGRGEHGCHLRNLDGLLGVIALVNADSVNPEWLPAILAFQDEKAGEEMLGNGKEVLVALNVLRGQLGPPDIRESIKGRRTGERIVIKCA